MTGGAGNDIFVFAKLTVLQNETSLLLGDDLVTDFANGFDRIDVTGLGLAWQDADADLDDGFAIMQRGSDVLIAGLRQAGSRSFDTTLSDLAAATSSALASIALAQPLNLLPLGKSGRSP